MRATLEHLLDEFLPWARRTPQARLLVSLLERDRLASFTEPATSCPFPELLAEALTYQPSPLTRALEALADDVVWFHPPPEVPEVMRQRAIAAELIGPDAAIIRDDVRFGLMAVAPHTTYDAHRHASDELYFVVSGGASWTVDGIEHEFTAGSVVDTPSMTSHAIATHDAPLVVLYSWTGDISFDSYEML